MMDAAADAERSLALSYAPPASRAGLSALFELDATLGHILRTTREPLVGQMRLTWWHDALCALDTAPPPAQPVLQTLAGAVLPRGVTGVQLAGMIDGWEALLDDPLDGEALARHAELRGAGLFGLVSMTSGAGSSAGVAALGRGWAYADVAANLRDAGVASLARQRAVDALREGMRAWPIVRAIRPLGALALSARMDLAAEAPPGAPRRVARLAWHRLSGR